MSGPLEGQVAIVTGGAGGIGGAIAVELAARGATPFLFDRRDATEAEAVLAACREAGAAAEYRRLELASEPDVAAAIEAVAGRGERLDIVVNCAGLARHEPLEDVTAESWREVVDSNLTAAFLVSHEAAPLMYAAGHGRIINIGSEQALLGDPNLVHYTAAKAGLIALTKSFASHYAPLVNVNLISPGPVATEKFKRGPHYVDSAREAVPLKRFGEPRDIALTVSFLAGEGGDFYTGAQLDPTGGAGLLPSPSSSARDAVRDRPSS